MTFSLIMNISSVSNGPRLQSFKDSLLQRTLGDVDHCSRLGRRLFQNICVLTTDFGGTPQFPFKTLGMPVWE